MTIDDRDEALLLALEKNARASVVALAQAIGLSRSATQERLARLERDGVIRGYTLRRSDAALGVGVRAFLTIRHTDKGSCAKLLPLLRGRPQLAAIYQISGEIDLLAEAQGASAAEIDSLAEEIRAIPGVARATTHIVLAAEGRIGRTP